MVLVETVTAIRAFLTRLAAEDTERMAELRKQVAGDRKQVRAFLKDLEDRIAGSRIPPPSIACETGSGRGRRPKLTAETCWAICCSLSQGTTLREAAWRVLAQRRCIAELPVGGRRRSGLFETPNERQAHR